MRAALKSYCHNLRALQIGGSCVGVVTLSFEALVTLVWVLASPFLALYGVLRPTQFFLFLQWLND